MFELALHHLLFSLDALLLFLLLLLLLSPLFFISLICYSHLLFVFGFLALELGLLLFISFRCSSWILLTLSSFKLFESHIPVDCHFIFFLLIRRVVWYCHSLCTVRFDSLEALFLQKSPRKLFLILSSQVSILLFDLLRCQNDLVQRSLKLRVLEHVKIATEWDSVTVLENSRALLHWQWLPIYESGDSSFGNDW